MKILSWNVNGIRAVFKKNFSEWFQKIGADIVCLQEIKAQKEQLPPEIANPKGYYAFFNFAQRPGYSGVAVLTKKKPIAAEYGLGLKRFDDEGRFLRLDFKNFTLINLYLPHGGRGKENLGYKLEVYKFLLGYLKRQFVIPVPYHDTGQAPAGIQFKVIEPSAGQKQRNNIRNHTFHCYSNEMCDSGHRTTLKNVVLTGDFNIAHTELDLARPKQNQNNIMFTPEERKHLDKIIKLGFTDTFRAFHAAAGHYTWWPYFANARARNLGWRIDYCFTSKSLTPKVRNAYILSEIAGSDHCPIGIEI